MATRIYHRIDSLAAWSAAEAASQGKLLFGEIGVATFPLGTETGLIARMCVNENPTPWSACPTVFAGTTQSLQLNGVETRPVNYESTGTPSDGATLAWNGSAWEATEEVLRLDAMPTANGTVVWNSSLGKFQVGNVLPANDIDGGSY